MGYDHEVKKKTKIWPCGYCDADWEGEIGIDGMRIYGTPLTVCMACSLNYVDTIIVPFLKNGCGGCGRMEDGYDM